MLVRREDLLVTHSPFYLLLSWRFLALAPQLCTFFSSFFQNFGHILTFFSSKLYSTQIINPFLGSMISTNHDKVDRFQQIMKSLLFIYCKISFVIAKGDYWFSYLFFEQILANLYVQKEVIFPLANIIYSIL